MSAPFDAAAVRARHDHCAPSICDTLKCCDEIDRLTAEVERLRDLAAALVTEPAGTDSHVQVQVQCRDGRSVKYWVRREPENGEPTVAHLALSAGAIPVESSQTKREPGGALTPPALADPLAGEDRR